MELNYLLNDYDIWKKQVNKYTLKILNKYTDDLPDLDFRYFFNKLYHPYLVSILCILQSNEFRNGKIFNSFIIPINNKIILIKK